MNSLLVSAFAALLLVSAVAAVPGGKSHENKNDPEIRELANFATGEMGQDHALISIEKAQSQVRELFYE